MTLSDLDKASAVLKLSVLSTAIGYSDTALLQRIRRGRPEISETEACDIQSELERFGLRLVTTPTATAPT